MAVSNKFIDRLFNHLSTLSMQNKLYLGMKFVVSILITIAVISIVGQILSYFQFKEVAEEHEPLLIRVVNLDSEIKKAQADLGFYLLSKDEQHKKSYLKTISKIEKELNLLKQQKLVQKESVLKQSTDKLISDFEQLKPLQDKILPLAVENNDNFPALKFASESINPLSLNILQNLSAMLDEELEGDERIKVLDAIHTMRYNWSVIMGTVRSYIAYRSQAAIENIWLYDNNFKEVYQKLQDSGEELTFIQEDSMTSIGELNREVRQKLEEMLTMHSSDGWRQDAHLIRTQVNPLLIEINKTIQEMVSYQHSQVADANSIVQKIVALVVFLLTVLLIIAYWGTKQFSKTLVKNITIPLTHAVEVSKRISEGDLTVKPEITTQDESGQVLTAMQSMIEHLSGLVGKIQQSGIQLTTSSTEIAATARQQEATVSEQAASTNEILATSKQISSTSETLVDTMGHVTGLAKETAEAASSGHDELLHMEESMHNMLDATGTISSKLQILSEKADNIGQVITTITKVADQTNLLSLNAAIEAEKAGEYGIGFSVVATEIRRLADQTAAASWDIEQIVKEMQTAVKSAVQGIDHFNETIRHDVQNAGQVSQQLADMIDKVLGLLPNFEEVRNGMDSHADSSGQISEAIMQLSEAAHQTVESLQSSSQAIQNLNEAAGILHESVSFFKVEE